MLYELLLIIYYAIINNRLSKEPFWAVINYNISIRSGLQTR